MALNSSAETLIMHMSHRCFQVNDGPDSSKIHLMILEDICDLKRMEMEYRKWTFQAYLRNRTFSLN